MKISRAHSKLKDIKMIKFLKLDRDHSFFLSTLRGQYDMSVAVVLISLHYYHYD